MGFEGLCEYAQGLSLGYGVIIHDPYGVGSLSGGDGDALGKAGSPTHVLLEGLHGQPVVSDGTQEIARSIGRGVVDDNDSLNGFRLLLHGLDALLQQGQAVVGHYDCCCLHISIIFL